MFLVQLDSYAKIKLYKTASHSKMCVVGVGFLNVITCNRDWVLSITIHT